MAEPVAGFTAVEWLPPFRLDARVLAEGPLEVLHPADALLPFARLTIDAGAWQVRPHPEDGLSELLGRGEAALRGLLAAVPEGDLAREARARRWQIGTALAALAAGEALRGLGHLAGWIEAAAARRRWYLAALDQGAPPPAEAVVAACRAVPQALRGLGNALPTAEAIRLLAPLGRICELGAGVGLFARALERAGLRVAASDAGRGGAIGLAFPVRPGFDAAATLDWFGARGELPPLLLAWPQFDEGAWFAEPFARARPGALIALASPEYAFCAGGGLATAPGGGVRPGWQAAVDLAARLARDFEPVGEAPLVAAGWPLVTTPLRLWRRRG